MEIDPNKILYDGKTKTIYQSDEEDKVLVHFHDKITAFNAKKKTSIPGKGAATQIISQVIFKELEKIGIPTHFIKQTRDNEFLAKKLKIIPIEIVTRNVVAGSLVKKIDLKKGTILNQPIIELYYKRDDLNDPMINDDHVKVLKLANEAQLAVMREMSTKINTFLINFLEKANLIVVDFKLEFGTVINPDPYDDNKGILLADEISPDTCRFWDKESNATLDKDLFRQQLSEKEVIDGYEEVAKRITALVSA